jgi:hypothetical protein
MKHSIGMGLLLGLLLILLSACGSVGSGNSGATGTSSTGSTGSRTNGGINTTNSNKTGAPNQAITPTTGATATASVISATPGSISTTQVANPVQISITDKAITSSVKTFAPQVKYTFIVANQSHTPQDFIIIQRTPQTQPTQGELLTLPAAKLPARATVHFTYQFPPNTANQNLEFTNHLAGPQGSGMQLPISVK